MDDIIYLLGGFMKKSVLSTVEKSYYKINAVIGEMAVVKDSEGKTALVNLTSDEIVFSFDFYGTRVCYNSGLIIFFTALDSNRKLTDLSKVSIYDAKTNKILCIDCDLEYEISEGDTLVFRSKEDGKLHLFDKRSYVTKNGKDILEIGLDDVSIMSIPDGLKGAKGKKALKLRCGDKFGMFVENYGLYLKIDCDSIDFVGNALTVLENGKKRILIRSFGDYLSGHYDTIKADPNHDEILYCEQGDTTFVYYIDKNDNDIIPIMRTEGSKVFLSFKKSSSNDYRGVYSFIVRKNDGYTVEEVNVSGKRSTLKESTPITNKIYKELIFKNGKYILSDGPKEEDIEEISFLNEQTVMVFLKNGQCYVIEGSLKALEDKFLVKCAQKIDRGYIVTAQNDEMTLYYKLGNGKVSKYNGANIEWLGGGYYTTEDKYGKMLCHLGKNIIAKSGKSVQIHADNSDNDFDEAKHVWALKRAWNNTVQLLKFRHHKNKAASLVGASIYDDVKFYPDFMIVKGVFMNMYDYNGNLLREFVFDVPITISGHIGGSMEDGTIYTIYDEDYIFENGKLVKISAKKETLHIAAYESEYGTVVVNSRQEDEFLKECSKIDALSEEEFERTLADHYASSKEIQKKYPSLVMRPVDKK